MKTGSGTSGKTSLLYLRSSQASLPSWFYMWKTNVHLFTPTREEGDMQNYSLAGVWHGLNFHRHKIRCMWRKLNLVITLTPLLSEVLHFLMYCCFFAVHLSPNDFYFNPVSMWPFQKGASCWEGLTTNSCKLHWEWNTSFLINDLWTIQSAKIMLNLCFSP